MDVRKLLSDEVRSPWLFLAVHVLPQFVLALILWRAWSLVSGELTAAGRGAYLTVLGMQGGMVVAVIAVGVALLRLRARVRWPVGLAFLTLNIAFLWAGLAWCDELVPSTVADWMLSPAQLAFAFSCLVGPALFCNALCVAGGSLPVPRAADIGGSVAAIVLIPTGWYVCVSIGSRFTSFDHIPFAVAITLLILSTAMVTLAFLCLLLWLYRLARGTFVPALLGGLVLPLGGLALNVYIPFPVNLQYWPVYVLTVVNGIVLLLPFRADRPMREWIWLARVAMYPFSLYFFVLFLPFLPLSILAMIAAGAGFLVLTPTVLFVIHSRMLLDEARVLGAFQSKARLLALFVAAMALLPLGYYVRATVHRIALMHAVEAVYAPDLAVEKPAIRPSITRAALQRLQNMKEGLYLPFLSEIYNRIVFNGMVLPDYKVKKISEDICGEDLSKRPKSRGRWGGDNFSDILFNTRSESRSWANTRPPPRGVTLKDVRITSLTTNGPLVEARIEVDLQNDAQSLAEYVGTVALSPSVSVSGFELEMKGEWVEGRVFDRKSALWVYHMIRDTTRRDPGLVVYTDRRHLRLSVFPFASSELRRCAIRLMFLAGDRTEIDLAGRRLDLGNRDDQSAPIVQVPLKGGGTALYVPCGKADRLPAVQRPVCVHFLLDVSARAAEAMPLYSKRIEAFLQRHPWATNTAATAVNFGAEPICPAGTLPDQLCHELNRVTSRIGAHGGYCPDTAIRRILFKELTGATFAPYATLFVMVAMSNAVPDATLDGFLEMVPDARVMSDKDDAAASATPVVPFLSGEAWILLSAKSGGWVFSSGSADAATFKTHSGAVETVVIPDLRASADSRLAAVAAIHKLSAKQMLYPASADMLRTAILEMAKQSGILAPETAYMVLETSAQRKALERAERKSLGANSALDFDEFKTPEPEIWMILVGFVVWLAIRQVSLVSRRRGIRRAGPADDK